MDVREKLVEMSEQLRYCADVSDCANCKRWDKVCENQCVDNLLLMAADLIDEVVNGVTVQGCGEWVYDHWCEFRCSVCGEFSSSKPYKGKENYCSNCGAKMKPQPPKGE